MKPYFVTYDAFPELRETTMEQAERENWSCQEPDENGNAGVFRDSPFDVAEHELGYLAFDDDGNLCAMGTTTDRNAGKDWQGNELEGSYLADRFHMNDSGAVHTFFYRRDTGAWLGQVYG